MNLFWKTRGCIYTNLVGLKGSNVKHHLNNADPDIKASFIWRFKGRKV